MKTPKNPPQAKRKSQASGPMVRRQTAVVLSVVMLLAGIFLGWQGAVIIFNQGAGLGEKPGMGQQAQQMPPGQSPMTSPLMAQAKALEEQAAKNPNDPAVWAKLGDFYYDAEMADRAVAAYQKSLALSPNQPDVWTDMGVMLRNQNKPQEALKAFEQAASIDPKHEQSRMNVGVVLYYDLKDKAGALKVWQDLLALNPQAKMPDGKSVADAVKELGGK